MLAKVTKRANKLSLYVIISYIIARKTVNVRDAFKKECVREVELVGKGDGREREMTRNSPIQPTNRPKRRRNIKCYQKRK